jgi:ATP-dependent RNA helicase DeaD
VAAAALKIVREGEKTRPIEKIGKVKPARSRHKNEKRRTASRNGKRKNSSKYQRRGVGNRSEVSHEEGMVRLSLGQGRDHGVSPGEIVGTIASKANIPGYAIGKILIENNHTFVDVPEEYVSRVLGQTGAYNFRQNQNVTIERAKV